MKSTCLLVCLLAFSSLDAKEAEMASRESVEKLAELTEVPKMIDAMQSQVGGMFDGFAQQLDLSEEERPSFEKYKEKVIVLMHEEVSWEKMKEPMLDIYMKHFSEAEVQGLIEFYSSDLGQSMIRKMPEVMRESMAISQNMMQVMMPKIQALALEMQEDIAQKHKENKDE